MKDYYSLEELNRLFYDWRDLIINIGGQSNDLYFDNSEHDKEDHDLEYFASFVHEYIHFLQNFATPWGVSIFADFSLGLMKIGSSSSESKDQIEMPVDSSSVNHELWKEGFKLRKDTILRGTYKNCNKNFNLKNTKLLKMVTTNNVIQFENDKSIFCMGMLSIKEHMAYLGTELFLSKSDKCIMKSIKNKSKYQPEYTILFEYYHNSGYVNVANGLFQLMEMCLQTKTPTKTLSRFCLWMKSNKVTSKNNLNEYISDWKDSLIERQRFADDYSSLLKHCRSIGAVFERHSSKHDLCKFVSNIITYSLKNLKKIGQCKSTFEVDNSIEKTEYWKYLVHTYGTGIINFRDSLTMFGSGAHNKKNMDSFLFLLSANSILKYISKKN